MTIFWVYLAFPIFYLVLGVVLVVIFMILPCFTVNKNTDGQCSIPFSVVISFQSLSCQQSLPWLSVFSTRAQ